jgi:hypothetical protein
MSADADAGILSEAQVLAKAKCASLADVVSLNFWGQSLADVSIVARLPALEVCSLSLNAIASLRDFASAMRLRELYLRRNRIADLRELLHLKASDDLRVLWLAENPVAEFGFYRAFAIAHLPQLRVLDDVEISADERDAAASWWAEQQAALVEQQRARRQQKEQREQRLAHAQARDGGRPMTNESPRGPPALAAAPIAAVAAPLSLSSSSAPLDASPLVHATIPSASLASEPNIGASRHSSGHAADAPLPASSFLHAHQSQSSVSSVSLQTPPRSYSSSPHESIADRRQQVAPAAVSVVGGALLSVRLLANLQVQHILFSYP